jgi:dTDP-4-dehydrorhamnose 3,5-epimerase
VSIAFDDPELAIPWPLPATLMSDRDRAAEPLAVALKQLDQHAP